jgi:hypothetical protein
MANENESNLHAQPEEALNLLQPLVVFSPEPIYASDIVITSSDQKQFRLHSQVLQMKSKVRLQIFFRALFCSYLNMHFTSQVFLAMESLGKDDLELDFNHHSEALLPFFHTLYSGNTLALTDANVLDVLKLAHMYVRYDVA